MRFVRDKFVWTVALRERKFISPDAFPSISIVE